jgi:hypothetical protein
MSDKPLVPTGPIVVLNYSVAPDKRDALFRFMEKAIPFYESPGGIRVRLYESADSPGTFQELVAYASRKIYEEDQYRIENDPEYKRVLREWHGFFDGELKISRMMPVHLSLPDSSLDCSPPPVEAEEAYTEPPKFKSSSKR